VNDASRVVRVQPVDAGARAHEAVLHLKRLDDADAIRHRDLLALVKE